MKKLKKFFVFAFFSLFFSTHAEKVVHAYTLTLKPKFNCSGKNLLIQGDCVSEDEAPPLCGGSSSIPCS